MRPRDTIFTVTDFEKFLRRNGFSRREARFVTGYGYRNLKNASDEGDRDPLTQAEGRLKTC
jgi:hypothetical protein